MLSHKYEKITGTSPEAAIHSTMMKSIFLLAIASILANTSQALRYNLDLPADLSSFQSSVDCEVLTVLGQASHQIHSVQHRCMTYSDEETDGAHDMVYDLPHWLLTKYADRLETSEPTVYLRIHGGRIDRGNDMIVARESAKVEMSDVPFHWSSHQHRKLAPSSSGTSSVLLVRVTTNDASVSLSADTISDRFFGSYGTPQSTFSDCSFGSLHFEPATGSDITNGVVELSVDIDIVGKTISKMENAIVSELTNKIGSVSHLQHVLFCVPPGSILRPTVAKWSGYAYVNSQRSFFNDEHCGYLSTVTHELGHNLGLGHSTKGANDYGDLTGISKYALSDSSSRMMVAYMRRH